MDNFRYMIQVFDGETWLESMYGANTLEAAELAERLLREDNGAWINPRAPKSTRIIDKQA